MALLYNDISYIIYKMNIGQGSYLMVVTFRKKFRKIFQLIIVLTTSRQTLTQEQLLTPTICYFSHN